MTVIAYTRGILATDSRALVHDTYAQDVKAAFPVVKCKSHKNKFAVAATGTVFTDKEWKDMLDMVEVVLGFIEIGNAPMPFDPGFLTGKWFTSGKNAREGLVITRKSAYAIVAGCFFEIPFDDCMAFGSGAIVATSMMQQGCDALKAVDMTCQVRTTVAYPLTHYRQKSFRKMTDGHNQEGIDFIKESTKKLIKRPKEKK